MMKIKFTLSPLTVCFGANPRATHIVDEIAETCLSIFFTVLVIAFALELAPGLASLWTGTR